MVMSPVTAVEMTGTSGESGDGGLQMDTKDVSSATNTIELYIIIVTTRAEHWHS